MRNVKQTQPFVQAYLCYQNGIFLIKNSAGLWAPIGGHVVRAGRKPNSTTDLRDYVALLEERIAAQSGIIKTEGGMNISYGDNLQGMANLI